MSDAELIALAQKHGVMDAPAPQAAAAKSPGISDAQLLDLAQKHGVADVQKPAAAASSGPDLQTILSTPNDLLQKVGKYTQAPVRSAIAAGQAGQNPFSAFGRQFGKDQALAPTGQDIARTAGITDNPIADVSSLPTPVKGALNLTPAFTSFMGPAAVLAPSVGEVLSTPRSKAVGEVVNAGADLTNLAPLLPKGVGVAGKILSALPEEGALPAAAKFAVGYRGAQALSMLRRLGEAVSPAEEAAAPAVQKTASALDALSQAAPKDWFGPVKSLEGLKGEVMPQAPVNGPATSGLPATSILRPPDAVFPIRKNYVTPAVDNAGTAMERRAQRPNDWFMFGKK